MKFYFYYSSSRLFSPQNTVYTEIWVTASSKSSSSSFDDYHLIIDAVNPD